MLNLIHQILDIIIADLNLYEFAQLDSRLDLTIPQPYNRPPTLAINMHVPGI